MTKSNKEIKQDYFDKVYANAEIISCACGCGLLIKNKDRYGRDKKYENGHNGRKYADPNQYKKEYLAKSKQKKKDVKELLIIEKGGKCLICKYKFDGRNHSAFDFHHRDSDEKEFGISQIARSDNGIELMKKEIKLCDLLCAVCHRLTHSGYFD